jgi:predicted DNA-binding protein
MIGKLYRAQILLEPRQHERLTDLARRENRSLSDKVRDIIAHYLAEQDDEARLSEELHALANLGQIREAAAQACGIYPGDPIAEARVEREAENDRVLGQHERRQ